MQKTGFKLAQNNMSKNGKFITRFYKSQESLRRQNGLKLEEIMVFQLFKLQFFVIFIKTRGKRKQGLNDMIFSAIQMYNNVWKWKKKC